MPPSLIFGQPGSARSEAVLAARRAARAPLIVAGTQPAVAFTSATVLPVGVGGRKVEGQLAPARI